ncbi:nuclear pore complex protein NUP1-like isoform X9 [Cornus florida]|uniref:nuclear pore complex protein NUP1-like isoform X9 n=1 Tax=Cornus florida TaxID=4283 RepID=UPI002896D84A|nr:nuclear pore complex protein NUP1-like isoform X9 [Cornus florida]
MKDSLLGFPWWRQGKELPPTEVAEKRVASSGKSRYGDPRRHRTIGRRPPSETLETVGSRNLSTQPPNLFPLALKCSSPPCSASASSLLPTLTRAKPRIKGHASVLHSRSVDLPVGNENRKTEANLPKPPSAFERKGEFANSPMLKTGTENCRLHGGLSTPIVSSRVLEEDVASPAELAKAYMGSRPSKATTPTLALRSQAPREDATLLNNIQFSPKSSIMSLAPKSALRLGVTENGFITPRSRGRSAIYDMARTPYSRVYSTANQKGVKSISDGFGEPSSSSQYAWEQDGYVGSKQVESEYTSVRRSSGSQF